MARSMFSAAVLSLAVSSVAALEIKWASDHKTYTVEQDGKALFSANGGVAAFSNGQWASQQQGTLKLMSTKPVSGSDPVLGAYSGDEIMWAAGSIGTPFVTTSKTFSDGLTVTFEQSWPKGASDTSLVKHNASGSKSNQEVIANFPAFTNTTLPGTLSWAGSFVGAQQNHGTKVNGPTGGPTVFYDGTDPKLSTVVVLSPLDNFKATSAGPGFTYDGKTEAFAPGTAGTITSIPAGFTQTFVMRLGSKSGITAAIGEWGAMLRAVHKTYKLTDVTLTNIGYQTDNGAGYVFCRPKPPYTNCNELLIDELKQLKAGGVPMGYLSFQGAGASTMMAKPDPRMENPETQTAVAVSGSTSAPWCVNEWGPDLNMTQRQHGVFPMDEGAFQKALGVPLQLYAPYFCPESKYFKRNDPSAKWTGVVSDLSLPGCGNYGFQDATPDESRAFYDWFFEKGIAVGMSSFEPDFMNQNYNCVPDFIESVSNSNKWQHGMTDAALAKNLTVQWCYAAPTDVLNSLDMPALTNFRVSNDFCYGHSWDIGVSSLIVWAAGSAPSKDTLWTTANDRFAVPGCNWSPDHEAPAAELHVVLALMSTGPVGISDKIGMTNVTLAKRMIAADGLLLKPSKPITSVDSALAAASGLSGSVSGRSAPSGYVYTTYTCNSGVFPSVNTPCEDVSSWVFVSFKMTAAWAVPMDDFYPIVAEGQELWTRSFNDAACVNGSDASTCVTKVGSMGVPVSVSDQTNVTGGTDYAPQVSTVWNACKESKAVFLGELDKYVSVSANRYTDITCTASGITVNVAGTAGETVESTFINADGKVNIMTKTFSTAGKQLMTFVA